MYCPNQFCQRSFIAYYKKIYPSGFALYTGISHGNIIYKSFSDKVNEISPTFVSIYNQAYAAQQLNLEDICGVGYRKALEFLIKDYAILNDPSNRDKIEKSLLGNVIKDYVADERIKLVAKRAVWLGNDETHYVRKWESKNIEDLIKVIDLTIHWIEIEILTKSIEIDMPE